jgi:hypothetical protein
MFADGLWAFGDEEIGTRGERQVRIQKKNSRVRGTYPLSLWQECGHYHCIGI